MNLGIYSIFTLATDFNEIKDADRNQFISETIINLNLSVSKAEKDIGIYKSTIKKMEQAKELLNEAKIQNKKKEKK